MDDEFGRTTTGGSEDNSLVDMFVAGSNFSVGQGGNQYLNGFFIDVYVSQSEFGFSVAGYMPTVEEWDAGQRPTVSSASVVMEGRVYDSNNIDPSYNPLLERYRLAENLDISVELDVFPGPSDSMGHFEYYKLGGVHLTAHASQMNAVPEPSSTVVWFGLVGTVGTWIRLRSSTSQMRK